MPLLFSFSVQDDIEKKNCVFVYSTEDHVDCCPFGSQQPRDCRNIARCNDIPIMDEMYIHYAGWLCSFLFSEIDIPSVAVPKWATLNLESSSLS